MTRSSIVYWTTHYGSVSIQQHTVHQFVAVIVCSLFSHFRRSGIILATSSLIAFAISFNYCFIFQVSVIQKPDDFHQTLIDLCSQAKRRISFASLYLGVGEKEQKLVSRVFFKKLLLGLFSSHNVRHIWWEADETFWSWWSISTQLIHISCSSNWKNWRLTYALGPNFISSLLWILLPKN